MSEGAVEVSTPGEGAGTSIPVIADPGPGAILSPTPSSEPAGDPPAPAAPVADPTDPVVPHWSDGFSNIDLRSDPLIKGFESAEALANEHRNLQSLIGRKGVIKPAEDAPESHWEKYFNDLGRPATPGEYKLEGFTRPEGVGWNVDGLEAPMIETMHKLGMSDAQVAGVLQGYAGISVDFAQRSVADLDSAKDAVVNGLKSEWGLAYDAKVDLAIRAANKNVEGGAKKLESIMLADGTSLADNPVMIRLLSKMGEISAEAGLIGDVNTSVQTLTPQQAKEAYTRFESENREALLDPAHLDHKRVVAEKMRLRQAMNG